MNIVHISPELVELEQSYNGGMAIYKAKFSISARSTTEPNIYFVPLRSKFARLLELRLKTNIDPVNYDLFINNLPNTDITVYSSLYIENIPSYYFYTELNSYLVGNYIIFTEGVFRYKKYGFYFIVLNNNVEIPKIDVMMIYEDLDAGK